MSANSKNSPSTKELYKEAYRYYRLWMSTPNRFYSASDSINFDYKLMCYGDGLREAVHQAYILNRVKFTGKRPYITGVK